MPPHNPVQMDVSGRPENAEESQLRVDESSDAQPSTTQRPPDLSQAENEVVPPRDRPVPSLQQTAGVKDNGVVLTDIQAVDQPEDAENPVSPTHEHKQQLSLKTRITGLISLRNGTLFGLTVLAFSFLQIFVSFAILQASDGAPVDDWKFQPNVYLAILTAISNEALSFAAVQGTVISWWLKARRGAMLKQLYHDYYQGINVRGALTAGRHFNVLALSCLCATFVNIDGPLLQRASTVRSRVPTQPVPLAVSIAPEIPSYFTGWVHFSNGDGDSGGSNPTSDFMPVMRAFETNETIGAGVSGCNGVCSATVRAPALIVESCQTDSWFINYTAPLSKEESDIAHSTDTTPVNRTIFGVGFALTNGSREALDLTLSISDDAVARTCAGNLTQHVCRLLPAVAEYPITIDHNRITFRESIAYPRLVAFANNTAITEETIHRFHLAKGGSGGMRTTLGGIATVATAEFSALFGLLPPVPGETTSDLSGRSASWLTFQHITNWDPWSTLEDCAPAFSDPREQILAGLNEIMFRTGVYVAQKHNETWLKTRIDDGLQVFYNVSGIPQSPTNFFEADLRYFFAAAAVEVFTVVVILYTFYGWWRLECTPTFNPLEIGKAFDAPLLRPAGEHDCAHQIAKAVGATSVRYRFIDSENGSMSKRQIFVPAIDA